jgi:hypothetical protein
VDRVRNQQTTAVAILAALVFVGSGLRAQPAEQPAPARPAPALPPAAPTTPPAPPVDVEVQVVPADVKLGGELRYRATFRGPAGTQVYFPSAPDVAPFDIAPGGPQVTRREEGGRVEVTVELPLRAYRLGQRKVPSIEVPVLAAGGEATTVTLPKQRVRVLSGLTTEAQPELALPGESVPVIATNWTLVWLAVSAGALVGGTAIAFALLWLLRRRERAAAPPPPPRPAHDVALEKLARIERERLPEQGRVMEYYVRISEALREYFGGRYGFDGLAMSTTELLVALRPHDLQGVPPSRVQTFLEECDLVKFASFAPEPKEIEWLLHTAYGLVRETMPPVVASPAPESSTSTSTATSTSTSTATSTSTDG